MAYTIERAQRIAEQLERFTTAYAHEVVGHCANLDFWLQEAAQALGAIDGYNRRFKLMAEAQRDWIEKHNTVVGEFCTICGGQCELEPEQRAPRKPMKLPTGDREEARKRLVEAARAFLFRCYRMQLLDKPGLERGCGIVGTAIEPSELERADKARRRGTT